MNFERIIKWDSGFDCIRFECRWDAARCYPRSGGSHGVYGLSIRFILKSDSDRAVCFVLHTGWLPGMRGSGDKIFRPLPIEVSYHSPTPLGEDDRQSQSDCDILSCGKCYSSSHYSSSPDEAFLSLCNAGIEALWSYLEGYYRMVFEGGPEPIAATYPKPERRLS